MVGGRLSDVVRLHPRDAAEVRLYVDRETGRPVQQVHTRGDSEIRGVYSDFQRIDGILFPLTVDSYRDGKRIGGLSRSSVALTFDEEPVTLERRLDAILRATIDAKRIPGLAAAVMRGDETFFERAYGHESVELDLTATLDSVFPLASVSKTVAGVVAMHLVERDALDLDASISAYLEGIPEGYRGITVRHLLNHSHGLADALSDNPGQGKPISAEEESTAESRFRSVFSKPLGFEPGQGWAYHGSGYELLQRVLESASGLDYETLAARLVFEPLGLASTRFGGSDRVVAGRLPVDYIWLDVTLSYNYLNYPREMFTAAGLNATAKDVAAFYRAVASGRLLSAASRDEMWREVVLPHGEATYYALGWGSLHTTRDRRWSVGHSGGGSSWTRYFPDSDLTVVVLLNLNGARADKLVYDLATAVEQAAP